MTPEQIQEIAKLRSLNLSPKQIARKLGLRPAEVNDVIRSQAKATVGPAGQKKELPPLETCLINEQAAQHLLGRFQQKGWLGKKKVDLESDGVGGMAQVIVVRREGRQYFVNSYLVDYWCLGVKDAFGPRKMNRGKYEQFCNNLRQTFGQKFRDISLEEAQSIIFGAIDYAANLGLKPHRDFERAKLHLGPRPETLLDIEFGRDGKPFYISGPYDQPQKIINTLREHVGDDNFEYISHL